MYFVTALISKVAGISQCQTKCNVMSRRLEMNISGPSCYITLSALNWVHIANDQWSVVHVMPGNSL